MGTLSSKRNSKGIKMLYEIGLLWFAHCVGDMLMQNRFMIEYKSKFWYPMFCHVFIWSTCISLVLGYLGIFTYAKFAFLFAGHYAMDSWKSRTPRDDKHYWCMHVDQGWHLIQIIIVWLL